MDIGQIAQQAERALEASGGFKGLADQAYAWLDQNQTELPAHVGVSGSNIIVFLPGYTLQSDPRDYILLSKRVA